MSKDSTLFEAASILILTESEHSRGKAVFLTGSPSLRDWLASLATTRGYGGKMA